MRFPSFRSAFRIVLAGVAASSLGAAFFACSSSESTETSPVPYDAGLIRDGDTVDAFAGDGTTSDAGIPPPPLSCTKYCDLVQSHCKQENAQYATTEDCLAFCAHLPPGDPEDIQDTAGLYCRQYYAGNPTLSEPEKYCAAAGPFGGGICGDRCTAFCQVALSACTPKPSADAAAGAGPYATLPKCKTECVEYTYKDAGIDGGGESLDGPKTGDTLNCRLYHLRRAVKDAGDCDDLGPDAGDCR